MGLCLLRKQLAAPALHADAGLPPSRRLARAMQDEEAAGPHQNGLGHPHDAGAKPAGLSRSIRRTDTAYSSMDGSGGHRKGKQVRLPTPGSDALSAPATRPALG